MYAFLNKYVFNLFFKTARKGGVFMVTGRALYSMGAAFWNDLLPAYFSDVRGTCNRCWSLHLNCLGTIFWDRKLVRYNGAMLWRALYVKHNTLNSIRSCMGNQWSCRRTGVICSYCLVLVIILAAVFCVLWMRWSWPCAIPYKKNSGITRVSEQHYKIMRPQEYEIEEQLYVGSLSCKSGTDCHTTISLPPSPSPSHSPSPSPAPSSSPSIMYHISCHIWHFLSCPITLYCKIIVL